MNLSPADCLIANDCPEWVLVNNCLILQRFYTSDLSQLPQWCSTFIKPPLHIESVQSGFQSINSVGVFCSAEFFSLASFHFAKQKAIRIAQIAAPLLDNHTELFSAISILGELFVLKFQKASAQNQISIQLHVDNSQYGGTLFGVKNLENSSRRVLVRCQANLSFPEIKDERQIIHVHLWDFFGAQLGRSGLERMIRNSECEALVVHGGSSALANLIDEIIWACKEIQLVVFSEDALAGEWVVFGKNEEIIEIPDKDNIVNILPTGLETTYDKLEEVLVLPLSQPQLFKSMQISQAPRVLIFGPSLSGKTTLVNEVVKRLGKFPVITVNVSSLFGQYLGGTEKRIAKVFEAAKARSPCLLVLEGIHLLVAKERDDEGLGSTYSRALAALLTGLDGVDADNSVAVLATSQLPPEMLQPAIVRPGRLENWIQTFSY